MKLSERLQEAVDHKMLIGWDSAQVYLVYILHLEAENAELKRVTSKFGGYEVSELLRVIANDYRNPKAADNVKDARSMWLIDFADALLTAEESE